MVLRAGIILPFQFGDTKKLLMVGSPEEERDLKLFDFTNVVRAAFNIYNFEFRNKKIDFLIPEELLIHYLEQCKDLTNFVIQIDQAGINAATITTDTGNSTQQNLTIAESLCSQHKPNIYINKQIGTEPSIFMRNNLVTGHLALSRGNDDLNSPLDVTSHSDHSLSNNPEPLNKFRRAQFYVDRTPESLAQSIDPNDIMPKPEQEESAEVHATKLRQQRQQIPLSNQTQHFYPNYGHTLLGTSSGMGQLQAQPQSQPQSPHPLQLQHATNRFRRRGERMSKDQKELYVKFFEDNPCMLQQRRNDAALAPLWNKLASMLNNVQQGAVKNVEEWKQTFDAWRYRVFMYSRYNSKLSDEAAQSPKNYKPLTHTDQRAYAMWISHRNSATSEYDKMDVFAGLEEAQAEDYDY